MKAMDGRQPSRFLERAFPYWSLAVCLLFALAAFLTDPDIMQNDSPSYIEMSTWRNALYPLYLALFRLLLPAGVYLQASVLVQDLLAAAAFWYLLCYVRRAFAAPWWVGAAGLAMGLFLFAASSWVAAQKLYMPNYLMTEGLAFCLLLPLFRLLLQAVLEKNAQPLLPAAVLVLLCMLLRGQVWFVLVLYAIVAVYVALCRRARFLTYAAIAGVCAAVLLLSSVLDRLYHLAANGVYAGTAFGGPTVASKMLYLSDREDAALFDDPELRETFLEMYDSMDARKLPVRYATGRLIWQYAHYEYSYDSIMWRTVVKLLAERAGEGVSRDALFLEMDPYMKQMILPLLRAHPDRYLKLTALSAFVGLVRSNSALALDDAPQMKIGIVLSFLLYAAAIALTVLALVRDRESRAARFMILSLLFLLGNIAAPVLVHFPISRYTMYAMIPFYTALMMLCYELFLQKRLPSAADG